VLLSVNGQSQVRYARAKIQLWAQYSGPTISSPKRVVLASRAGCARGLTTALRSEAYQAVQALSLSAGSMPVGASRRKSVKSHISCSHSLFHAKIVRCNATATLKVIQSSTNQVNVYFLLKPFSHLGIFAFPPSSGFVSFLLTSTFTPGSC